jgi:hypothetical protein
MQELTMDVVFDPRLKSHWSYRLGEATGDGQRPLGTGVLDVGSRSGAGAHITLHALCDEDGDWTLEWREEGSRDMRWDEVLAVVDAAADELPTSARAAWRHACAQGCGPDAMPTIEGWRVIC